MRGLIFILMSVLLNYNFTIPCQSARVGPSGKSVFPVSPRCDHISDSTDDAFDANVEFLLHVVTSVKMKSITIISDGSPGLEGTDFAQHLPCGTMLMIFHLPDASRFSKWFRGIMSTEGLSTKLLVLGNFTFVSRVFSEVDESTATKFHWLTLTPRDSVSSFWNIAMNFDNVATVITEPDGNLTLGTSLRQGDKTAPSLVARWSPLKQSKMPSVTEDAIFPNFKYGLGGRTLKMVTMTWNPFTIRHRNNNSTWYTGLCIDLLELLSANLNFTYTISEATDGIWGARLPNGTWAGMTGMLHRKEVDFALAGMSLTPDRSTVTDYTMGFYYDAIVMVTTWPDPVPVGWTFFIRPFHWLVYVLMGSCLVFVAAVLVCVERLHARTYNRQQAELQIKSKPLAELSVLDAAETLFGSFIGRAVSYASASNSGRVLLCSWYLLSLVTVATYTGKLISNSVVVQQPLPFNTLGELVQRTDYKWGYGKGTNLETIFSTSNNSNYQLFYHKILSFMEDDPDVVHPKLDAIGIAKLLGGQFVRISSYSVYHHLSTDYCKVTMASEKLFHDTLVIYLQKGSPYLTKFNEVLSKATESGVMEYITRKWFPEKKDCNKDAMTVVPVTLELTQSAFALALAGSVIAAMLLGIEYLTKRMNTILK